jgi:hypothetical protein
LRKPTLTHVLCSLASSRKKVRNKRWVALVKHGVLSQQRADQLEADEVDIDAAALKALAATGLQPLDPLGKNPWTWSGLSDFAVMEHLGLDRWYDLYYSPFSDSAHVNAAGIGEEVAQLMAGHVSLGHRFESPWHLVAGAMEAISHAAAAMDSHYGLGEDTALHSSDVTMLKALGILAASEAEKAWAASQADTNRSAR